MCIFCVDRAPMGKGRNEWMFNSGDYQFRLGDIWDEFWMESDHPENAVHLPCIRLEHGDLAVNSYPIQYCPMCGRKLVNMNKADGNILWTKGLKGGAESNV